MTPTLLEPKIVYVVIGHSGEHDSYHTWVTKGFFDKDNAENFCINCKAEAHRIKEEVDKFNEEVGLKDSQEKYGYSFVDPEMLKIDPLEYWEKFSEIIDRKNNTVDEQFEFDMEYIDYTIDEVKVY